MYTIISVDESVYTSKVSDEMTAAQAAEKTYDMLRNNEHPAMSVHLATGGILVLGPEVVARAHITYYDEEKGWLYGKGDLDDPKYREMLDLLAKAEMAARNKQWGTCYTACKNAGDVALKWHGETNDEHIRQTDA